MANADEDFRALKESSYLVHFLEIDVSFDDESVDAVLDANPRKLTEEEVRPPEVIVLFSLTVIPASPTQGGAQAEGINGLRGKHASARVAQLS